MISQRIKPYKVDISFLQPVIDAYKIGLFKDIPLPPRVLNALDSLSWYGNVKRVVEVPDPRKIQHHKKYTKKSAYWQKFQKEAEVKEKI